MPDQNNIYALFVGINEYAYRRPDGRDINLYGCVNDVNLLSALLQQRYNISAAHTLILLNEQATKQNVITGFQQHLAQANQGDTAVFYFSGHGSTEKTDPRLWRSERDQRNETLVCHDSRTNEQPYDLADKELRYLIYQLSNKGVNVVTIIDSCNSGDATRYINDDEKTEKATQGETETSVRQTPGSNASRPLDTYLFFKDAQQQGWLNNVAAMPEGDHIAISACRNDQLSKEIYFRRKKHGVFTYHLHQALQYQHVAPSYRNLVDAAAQRVTIAVDNQTPQLDPVGQNLDIHQTFLATELQPVTYAASYHAGGWWLNAGIPQGINRNARLNLVLAENKTVEATVSEVSPADTPEQGSLLAVTDDSVLEQGKQYQAQMLDPAITKLPLSFAGSAQHIEALIQTLNTSDNRYYLAVDKQADYVLSADEQAIIFSRKQGLPLDVDPVKSIAGNQPREWVALKLAAHMAKWHHTMNLVYTLREDDIPRDLIQLAIAQYNPPGGNFITLHHDEGSYALYYQQTASGELKKPEIKLSVSINDEADWPQDEDIFISLLSLDPIKGSTHILTNQQVLRKAERFGEGGVLKPACPVWTYEKTQRGRRKETITFSVPERLLQADGSGYTNDYLKLIISNFAIDISALEQTSLSKLLEQLNPPDGQTKRSMDDDDDEGVFIRTACTQTFTLNIIKPAGPQRLNANQRTALSAKVEVLPHDIPALVNLEYSAANPDTPSALRIDLAENQQRNIAAESVSIDNPLQLELDASLIANEDEGLLVFSRESSKDNDHDFEIPIGFAKYQPDSGKTKVTINQLPAAESTSTRSIGGSLLLFFKKVAYEKLKLERDTVQLAIPIFASEHSLAVADYIKDVDTIKQQVADADKILLFIHGITGDTEQMAGVVNQVVDGKRLGAGCLALTFDYENLNTPIQETADHLRKKLKDVGLAGEHGKELVIIAHSMGGLVARWMLEKDPACPAVAKLIMLGTPNGGSPLQDVKKWLLIMITLATNGVAGVASGIGVAGLMYMLKNIDDTLDEMGSDSKTLRYLYEAADPKVPYFMIAGDTAGLRVELEDEGSRFSRLLAAMKGYSWLGVTEMMTAGLFREGNDVAVGYSSMVHVPRGREFEMGVFDVEVDHLSYFRNKEGAKQLAQILQR